MKAESVTPDKPVQTAHAISQAFPELGPKNKTLCLRVCMFSYLTLFSRCKMKYLCVKNLVLFLENWA